VENWRTKLWGCGGAPQKSDDLAAIDEFHLGGREATQALAEFMHLRPGMHLLDVGCGIGGPARYFAERGCQVTGIDLTEEFVRVAESLSRRVKLNQKVTLRQASALELPFDSDAFDGAYTIHVGMPRIVNSMRCVPDGSILIQQLHASIACFATDVFWRRFRFNSLANRDNLPSMRLLACGKVLLQESELAFFPLFLGSFLAPLRGGKVTRILSVPCLIQFGEQFRKISVEIAFKNGKGHAAFAMWPLSMPATTYSPTHFRVQYNRPGGA
jgi:SAM-dependent methyltransferase